MNMTQKVVTSFVAVAAFSAILVNTTSADSMKPTQLATVVVTAVALPSGAPASGPLNSKETPEDQLKDLQY